MTASGADRWDGKIHNVDGGKVYDRNLIMEGTTELRIHGCILSVCQSQTVTRQKLPPDAVSANPVQPPRTPILLQRAR